MMSHSFLCSMTTYLKIIEYDDDNDGESDEEEINESDKEEKDNWEVPGDVFMDEN